MHRRNLPLAAIVIAALAGCAPAPPLAGPGSSAPPSATESTSPIDIAELCEREIVVRCDTTQPGALLVVVSATASDDATIALAADVRDAAEHAGLTMGATLEREITTSVAESPEYATPPPWTTPVHPGTAQEARDAVASLLAVEDVPGVVTVSAPMGWPSVSVATVDAMPAVFATASSMPWFADGGSYSVLSTDDRLRIEHTPRWVTPAAVEAVVAVSAAYPEAEVLLEAMRGGEAAPTLYVARLTTAQLAQVEAMLADPELAGASLTGGVPYVLTSLDDGGSTVTGAFGA